LGRWLSLDPLQRKYAYLNPYHFTANNPIAFVDNDGKDFTYSIIEGKNGEKTILINMTVYAVSLETCQQALAGAAIWNDTEFTSKGYSIKFDIEVVEPPSITEAQVIERAEKSSVDVIRSNGNKKKRAYNAIERELQDEQMMEIAKDKYLNGVVGDNNVYAGANDFGGLETFTKDASMGGNHESARSNGKAIVSYVLEEYVTVLNTNSNNTQEIRSVDQGTKSWIVAHEIGHNMGFPDYTDFGVSSRGIMDYDTDDAGNISQFEIDDLFNQILKYQSVLETTPDGTRNKGATGSFKWDYGQSSDEPTRNQANFKHSEQPQTE
jgi:hypothetical protein